MRPLTPFLIATALLFAAPATAQIGPPARIPPGAPVADVSVRIGPGLEVMADRYGRAELDDLAKTLQRRVALTAGKGGFVRADLVLEDVRPNRPTIAQQSRNVSLSSRSLSIGGARISGSVTRADGSTAPLLYSWFESDIRDERGFTTWYDVERAFDWLGGDLARGKVPDRLGPGTPTGRYVCRGYADVWCTSG